MRWLSIFKHYFYSAFRELFVYHHTSLEFRAKLYALMILSSDEPVEQFLPTLNTIATNIYHDTDRAGTLIVTTQEYIASIRHKKHLNIDKLLQEIIQELREVPRYALKIEPEHLEVLRECAIKEENRIYLLRLISFLVSKREEYEENRAEKSSSG